LPPSAWSPEHVTDQRAEDRLVLLLYWYIGKGRRLEALTPTVRCLVHIERGLSPRIGIFFR
jgi:hypothetical protein